MSQRTFTHGRFRGPGKLLLVLAVLWPSGLTLASDEEGYQEVVRVEEDWVLVLNSPNDDVNSPQFHTIMSPFPHLDSYYGQVIWNYRETPDYEAGGLQIESWQGETRQSYRALRPNALSTVAETITWTQALETNGVELYFEIINGDSTTWGQFGRDMRITADASILNLESYDPQTTVNNSWIHYGSNRVDKLMITEVRRYSVKGLVSIDPTPRVVFELIDDGDVDE